MRTLIVVKPFGRNFIDHLLPALDNYALAFCREEFFFRVKEFRPEVVIFEWGNDLTALVVNSAEYIRVKRETGFTAVIRIHDHEVTKYPQRAKKINYTDVDKVWFINPEIEDLFKSTINSRVATFFLPNCVEPSYFPTTEKTKRAKKTAGLLSIYCRPRKGLRRFLQVAALRRDWLFKIRTHIPEQGEPFYAEYRRCKAYEHRERLKNVIWEHRDATALISSNYNAQNGYEDLIEFYCSVDAILSTSFHEGFHYAVAQGMLSGCKPVVFAWPTSRVFYEPYVVESVEEASRRLYGFARSPVAETDYRKFILDRYTPEKIYSRLITQIAKTHIA